jgi:putative ABC transport system permease protein
VTVLVVKLPWLRAPRAGLASPITALVAVSTGLVLAFIAAGTVSYVSATGSAAVQYVVGRRCPDNTGVILASNARNFGPERVSGPASTPMPALRDAAARHGLDLVRRSRYAQPAITVEGREVTAQLLARHGAFEHLRPTSGGGTVGAWVPANVAQAHQLRPGSVLTLTTTTGAQQQLPVAAIYPTFVEPLDDYWCSQRADIIPPLLAQSPKPPTIVVPDEVMDGLVAADSMVAVTDRLQVTGSRPADSRTAADERASAVAAFRADAARILGSSVAFDDQAAFPAATGQRAQRAVRDSLLPLSGISLLVGLAAVVGLAGQWVQRRHAEIRLLWVRGASPAALGVKAVLELVAPLAVGCALGWVAARLAVPLLAPAPQLDPWVTGVSVAAAVTVWALSAVLLGVAAARRVRRRFQPGRRVWPRVARVARWLPWELAALAGAVASYRRLRDGALVVEPSRLLPTVDVLALMFPLFCLGVVVGVALRLAVLGLRASHRLRGWRVPAALWAARRAMAQHRLTAALLAVAGLAVGVIAIGSGVSATEQQAIDHKGRIFVGSDAAIRLITTVSDRVTVPDAIRDTSTVISLQDVTIRGGNRNGRIIVIDPASFANGVTWRPEWGGGVQLGELLGRLGPVGPDGRAPVIQVGSAPAAAYLPDDDMPSFRPVGTVSTFPARGHADGMLVIAYDAMAGLDMRGFSRMVLTREDPKTAVQALESGGEPTGALLTAPAATDGLPFLAVAWTFNFFVPLGAILAVVAAAVLLVSIEARRRSTAVASALLARMGLRVRTLFASHVIELASLAALAGVAGMSSGWLVLAIAAQRLDPVPRLSPAPIPASLVPLAATTGALAALAVLLAAGLAVRSALRAPVRELLRT